MMDLSDAELAQLGYRFAVGYTDGAGDRTIMAETSLRYCHTTPEIFNNPALDFWTFAFVETADGGIVMSNLRHLDGTEEECLDPLACGFDPAGRHGAFDDGEWITVMPSRVAIRIDSATDSSVAIYNVAGMMVYTKTYAGGAPMIDEIELSGFPMGSYVVALSTADGAEVKAKKIIVR